MPDEEEEAEEVPECSHCEEPTCPTELDDAGLCRPCAREASEEEAGMRDLMADWRASRL